MVHLPVASLHQLRSSQRIAGGDYRAASEDCRSHQPTQLKYLVFRAKQLHWKL